MNAINKMVDETKVLCQNDRKKIIDELEEEFPNVNEQQLEDRADELIKDQYVDTFIKLFQRNVSFCWNLFHSNLGQRVLEERNRLINQEEVDSDDENLLLDSIEMSRETIEDLF